MYRVVCAAVVALSLAAGSSPAGAQNGAARVSLCLLIDAAARANRLPAEFLTRVIWRESRFDPLAVGPATRGGARAEGIAQFMPGTAADRALADPFDPVQALPKAAAFLSDLRDTFGNLGLAAAAYNAGPQRVRGWLVGARTMPDETRRYVHAITGRGVDEWAGAVTGDTVYRLNCEQTLAALNAPPAAFASELEQRVGAAIGKPWGVELAAGFTRGRVLALYTRAVAGLAAVIGGRDPVIVSTVLRSRGTRPFYQARIGADTRMAADVLCGRIRHAGGACIVTRNLPGRFRPDDRDTVWGE